MSAYVTLQHHVVKRLPPIEVSADSAKTQQLIDLLAAAIGMARVDATTGDVFTPDVAVLLRVAIQKTLRESGGDLAGLLAEIDEGSPSNTERPAVNGPFPWSRGVATPQAIIAVLPPLPEELQYRFADRDLILLDILANLVVDVLPGALPYLCTPQMIARA